MPITCSRTLEIASEWLYKGKFISLFSHEPFLTSSHLSISRDPKSVPSTNGSSRPASVIPPSLHAHSPVPQLHIPLRYRSRSPPVKVSRRRDDRSAFSWMGRGMPKKFLWFPLDFNVQFFLFLVSNRLICHLLPLFFPFFFFSSPPNHPIQRVSSSSCSSPLPGSNYRPQTPQLPTTVFPPTNGNLHLYDETTEEEYQQQSYGTYTSTLSIPTLTVTGPNYYAPPPPPPSAAGKCFSPQPTRDAYQMEPDEETAAVLNQVINWTVYCSWLGFADFPCRCFEIGCFLRSLEIIIFTLCSLGNEKMSVGELWARQRHFRELFAQ